VREIGKIK